MNRFKFLASLAILSLLTASPSTAEVEIPVKGIKGTTSGKMVRFLPFLLLHKDDTYLNAPSSKKEDFPQTMVLVEPYVLRLKNGSTYKRLYLTVSGEKTEGPSVEAVVSLTPNEAKLLALRLQDIRRVIKRWDAIKDNIPKEERSKRLVVFNPHKDVGLTAEMTEEGITLWSIRIKDITSIGFIHNISETVHQIEKSSTWLATGKL